MTVKISRLARNGRRKVSGEEHLPTAHGAGHGVPRSNKRLDFQSQMEQALSKHHVQSSFEAAPMLEIEIPGFGHLCLERLVLDYSGTLAIDGAHIAGVAERLTALARQLDVYVLTADTYGTVRDNLRDLPVQVHTLAPRGKAREDEKKRIFVENLGSDCTVYIGNGRNDRLALHEASLGIAVVQAECAAPSALSAADLIAPNIHCALDALLHPVRLVASLRV